MWTEAREIEKHYIRTTLIITSHWLLFVENVSLSIPSGIQANKSQGTNTFSESGSPECSNVNYSWQHCNVDGNMAIDTRIRTTQKIYDSGSISKTFSKSTVQESPDYLPESSVSSEIILSVWVRVSVLLCLFSRV